MRNPLREQAGNGDMSRIRHHKKFRNNYEVIKWISSFPTKKPKGWRKKKKDVLNILVKGTDQFGKKVTENIKCGRDLNKGFCKAFSALAMKSPWNTENKRKKKK